MHTASQPVLDSATPDFGPAEEIIAFDSSVLLAESDHRIANHLTLLMGHVRLKTADMDRQHKALSRRTVQAVLEGVSAQIAAVAKLHRALVTGSPLAPVDLGEHLHEVCAPFANSLSGEARIIEDFAPGCVVDPEQVLPLIQIAAKVLTNALKHASHGAQPGAVRVHCRKDGRGEVQLEISDSGGGLPAAFDPKTDGGLGFRLVRGLSQKLGARTSFDSTAGGVRFRLTLAATAPARP